MIEKQAVVSMEITLFFQNFLLESQMVDSYLFLALSKCLKRLGSKVFLQSRISARALQSNYKAKRGVIKIVKNRIVACCFLWDTPDPELIELGTFWVTQPYRGDKFSISSEIFASTLLLMPKQKTCFVLANRKSVIDLCFKNYFEEVQLENFFQASVPESRTLDHEEYVVESWKFDRLARAKKKGGCRIFIKKF